MNRDNCRLCGVQILFDTKSVCDGDYCVDCCADDEGCSVCQDFLYEEEYEDE